MAGLLGDATDPQSLATWNLVAGLLSPGSFGQGLGKGIAGYQGALANGQDMQLKQQQIIGAQQEAQMREIAMQQAQRKLQWLSQFGDSMNGKTAPAAPTVTPSQQALAVGAQNGSVGPTQMNAQLMGTLPPPQQAAPAPTSRFAGIPADQMALGIAGGAVSPEMAKFWNEQNTGTAMQPGYRIIPGQAPQYLGDPTKGITLDANGRTVQMPGSADTQAAITAAIESAKARATNQNTLVPLDRLDRMPSVSPTSNLDDLIQAGKPQPTPPGFPAGTSAADAQRIIAARTASGEINQPFKVNGAPVNLGGSATAPQASAPGFKTAADVEADKLRAAQPVNFQTKMLVDAHTENAAAFAKLNDTLRNEAELQNRNVQLMPLLDKMQTGGFAPEQRIAFANSLQTSGIVPDVLKGKVAEWVANGDPTAGKVIENQLAAAGIKTMLDTLDKEGKPNRAIFQAIQEAQESIKSGNGTLKQVFNLQKQLYDWHYQQQQQMGKGLASPDYNPLTFQADVARQRNESIPSVASSGSAVDLPANPTASVLKVGTVYKLPNGSTGKWDGFKFKGQ